MKSTLNPIRNVLFNVVSPMNAGFMIGLNIMEIAFIVYSGLEKKVSSIPYLVCLSLSDLLMGLTIFGVKAFRYAAQTTGNNLLSTIGDYINNVMIELPLVVSVLTFTMLTIDRWLAVKKPFIYRNLTRKRRIIICFVIWVIAIATTFSYTEQSLSVGVIALAGMPFPITGYILIRRALKKSQAMGANGQSRAANKNERRMLSLCVKTFVAYIVCWIPYSIFIGIEHFRAISRLHLVLMNVFVFTLIFINSTVNPLICLHHFGVHRIIRDHFVNMFESV